MGSNSSSIRFSFALASWLSVVIRASACALAPCFDEHGPSACHPKVGTGFGKNDTHKQRERPTKQIQRLVTSASQFNQVSGWLQRTHYIGKLALDYLAAD